MLGVRTLHDAPHLRTVHQVLVFVHGDDDARHVCANGLGTPEAVANGFHQVIVHRIHTAAKPSDESLTARWRCHQNVLVQSDARPLGLRAGRSKGLHGSHGELHVLTEH